MDPKLIKALELCFDKPPEDAIEFLESQGFEISKSWRDQIDAVNRHAFTVAGATSADMLQVIHDAIVDAMNGEVSFHDFKKQIEIKLNTNGFLPSYDDIHWRLDTIYRTNLQSAYHAGRYFEQMEVSKTRPFMIYHTVGDKRVRPSHAAMDNTALPSSHSFWATNYPPNGYKCRCYAITATQEDLDKLGIKLTPDDALDGLEPDEGFASSPAKQWTPDLSKYEPWLAKQLEKHIKEIE